jgi:excisionase family DNA binding protein
MIQGLDDRVPRLAFTVDEAARALGVSASSVRRQIRSGNLTVVRVGALVRIPAWALDAYTRPADHSKQSA